MTIKITGNTPDQFERIVDNIMTTACQVICRGYDPPILKETGKPFHYNALDGRYELIPATNDHWAHIRRTGENLLLIEFSIRYDRKGEKKRTLTELISAWYSDNVELIP